MKQSLIIIVFGAFVLVSRAQVALDAGFSDTTVNFNEPQLKLIYFLGSMNDNRLMLKWNVTNNESITMFEVKKSHDGKNFTTGAFVFASEKKGNETYFFPDIVPDGEKTYYRLKIVGNNKKVKYSKVLSFEPPSPDKNSVAAVTDDTKDGIIK